ncbi:heterokaryon incompatibility protein-domain-containing protein [Massariosphaeria phaeospora]|uniref:Heterokaryon incompatibility protein-domain-containing protein n=1 Tax=Massariosphaeria phaeospora TaxID=100035 RepID=A0A7C8I1I1_9PLEO|nr:heterokaryon incompatibility protein-domain-containing protein [Massariosphaeria phaeospora]
MQRDTALTFRDIHGSEEALIASIKKIERIALVRNPEKVPLRLRFVTPYYSSKTCADFALTPAHRYQPGEDYVTVSYTWAHAQSDEGQQVPDYRIWDLAEPGAPPRPIRCPKMVFHRAMLFAQARKCPYVWIDQECINQQDPTDIERHLQVMDRIYSDSRWTVAVLSCNIANVTLLDRFKPILDILAEPCTLLENERQPIDRLVRYITQDRWFSRTWTFHEKNCAKSLALLIPTVGCTSSEETLRYASIGSDLCVDIDLFYAFGFLNQTNINDREFEQYFFRRSRFEENIMPGPHEVFGDMEKCDNSVTADRLAIFANISGLKIKLNSTALTTPEFSYSTCILALVLANLWSQDDAQEDSFDGMRLLPVKTNSIVARASTPDSG